MKLKGDIFGLQEGCGILYYGILNDIEINVKRTGRKGFLITSTRKECCIEYGEKVDFFRGMTILADQLLKHETEFKIEQSRNFDSCGVQIDASRNAVPKVETVKDIITYMAKMGLNRLSLYTEDTYKMEKYPYFGYMRGAYTKEELKEIVRFAGLFGIEVVPTIQVLGHLERTLHWQYADGMRDTRSCLLVDEESTYEFIEEMIKTARECFNSEIIYIGMDETHDLGSGAYFHKYGYIEKIKLWLKHLNRVAGILEKYNFQAEVSVDMLFVTASKKGLYYDDFDLKIPEELSDSLPENIKLVFWDYYHINEESYDFHLELCKPLKRELVFFGGIWTWMDVAINYDKTFLASRAGLGSCIKNGIRDVVATSWGDDGMECNVYSILLGMQLYAEYNYSKCPSDEQIERMFKLCTGFDMEAFQLMSLSAIDGAVCPEHNSQAAKQVLQMDILQGLFDKNLAQYDFKSHFKSFMERMGKLEPQGKLEYLIEYHRQMAKVLYEKCDIGIRLTDAYLKNQRDELQKCVADLRELYDDFKVMHEMAAQVWYKSNKPFGFEVMDHRLGGLETRILRAEQRVLAYLNGDIESVPELEEPRLYYTMPGSGEKDLVIKERRFAEIFTVGQFFGS